VNADRDGIARTAFPHAGPLKTAWWPSPVAPRYMLVFGSIPHASDLPAFGLAVIDGTVIAESIWTRPVEITPEDLMAWLERVTNPEASRAMVAQLAADDPELFARKE
jgi:hypothetical protein